MALRSLRLGLAMKNNKGENMEPPFQTNDPIMKGIYAAANAIVAQQRFMVEAMQEEEGDNEPQR